MKRTAFLEWRIRVFFLGGFLGLLGVFADVAWLVAAALAVLLVGFALRLWPAAGTEDEDESPED